MSRRSHHHTSNDSIAVRADNYGTLRLFLSAPPSHSAPMELCMKIAEIARESIPIDIGMPIYLCDGNSVELPTVGVIERDVIREKLDYLTSSLKPHVSGASFRTRRNTINIIHLPS